MSPKSSNTQLTSKKIKSVVIASSKSDAEVNATGNEEAEIAAQITVPTDGGWGWVVLMAAFMNMFILNGQVFTFGALIPSITDDFSVTVSMAALLGSTEMALYYMVSPFASALINKFGFRVCLMTGSILCSISKLFTYFCKSFLTLCVLYGWVNGFGSAFINMSSSLIVGFYFEKYRNLALSITGCGTSLGIMIMSPTNNFLVNLAGWRSIILLHSGMLGLTFFFGMAFRPLLSITILETLEDEIEEPTRTVTMLPNLDGTDQRSNNAKQLLPSGAERLFSAPSNVRFPTAGKVLTEVNHFERPQSSNSTAPTTSAISRITLKINKSEKHVGRVKSMISDLQNRRISVKLIATEADEKDENVKKGTTHKKEGCCIHCCQWNGGDKNSRPLYRDDIFYEGKIESLPAYQKSIIDIPENKRTGLEYQLAVSRAVGVEDMRENKWLYATAVRRVLASMFDPALFKRGSFLVLCIGGLITNAGLVVPYIFLAARNAEFGIAAKHCGLFLSVIGLANTFGKLICGFLVKKIEPVNLHTFSLMVSGLSTIASTLSSNLYFQYGYCVIFGLSTAGISGIRSVMLVSLYGLEKLTNSTGILLIFVGLGTMVSTPLAGALKQSVGYNVAFYVAGALVALSGINFIFVRKLVTVENKEEPIEINRDF